MTEERKLVTVLFADIVGSTEIGLDHDPEVVRSTLARAFDAVREVLVAHGGTVEKFIGDAVMAVFGVPAAHEDDADRAVRAAFALRERASSLGGRMSLEVRVGVNTGEAVAGSGATDQLLVTGTPVTAATRLQQAAAPGEILVGKLAHTLTHDGVRYGASREVPAKGLGHLEAWPALEVVSALPEAHRGLGPLRAPLIGRERELRLLEDALARVGSEAAPGLVTILGPAGAGKSRLASEFLQRIDRGRVLSGRCLPYGQGITFYPLQQMVRDACGIDPLDDHAAAMEKLSHTAAALFDDASEAQATSARVAAAVGLSPVRDVLPDLAEGVVAEELRYGVRRFFERRAAREGLVLVFEDLQWAETALVELVEHLAEWSRAPILLLCLARPDFRDTHPHFAAEAANASTVTLAPLTAEETRRLVAELLAIEALPGSLRSEVVRRTEGNPLYVEEFLRLLIETGRIERRDGRWVATGDVERLEVPPTLVGLVSARLDRVSPEVKRVLQLASVAGRVVSAAGLEAIEGAPIAPERLREAVRRDLLAETDERALGTGRAYRFKHLLTRDVAYGAVPKAERARLHDRYGRWLETALGDRGEEASDLIAVHAEQAFLFAKEIGAEGADELGARALDQLLSAATRARRGGDLATAVKLYERAAFVAEALPSAFAMRAEAVGFAAALRYAGRRESTPTLDAEFAQALALAEQLGPSELLVHLLLQAAHRVVGAGQTDNAHALQDRLLRTAEATGDVDLTAHAMVECALLHYFLGDFDRRVAGLEAALEYMNGHGARRELVRCLLLLAEAERGTFTAAHRYVAEAETLRSTWSKSDERHYAQRRMYLASWAGDASETLRWGEEARKLATELGLPSAVGMTGLHMGQALLDQRAFAEAREVLAPAVELFEKRVQRQFIPEVRARLALAYIGLGDLAAARDSLDRAEKTLLPDDDEAAGITGLAAAALAEAEGWPAEAEDHYRETIVAIDVHGSVWSSLARVYVAFGAFLVRQGRYAEARGPLERARGFYSDPLAFRQVERIDALLRQCELTD